MKGRYYKEKNLASVSACITLGESSDWTTKWREFLSKPITQRSNEKSVLFDTQMITTLSNQILQ